MLDITLKRSGYPSRQVVIAVSSIAYVIVFFLHRKFFLLAEDVTQISLVLVVSVTASLAFSWVDYRRFGDIFRRLARLSAIGVLAYLLFEPVDMTLAVDGADRLHRLITYSYWPAVAFAVVGAFRPSMAYAPAMFLLLSREAAPEISGYNISTLDIRYMMDMAMFLGISASILGLLKLSRSPIRLNDDETEILEQCLAFSAIGMHLANYLWSGYAKFALGPTPATWVLENPTASSIPMAIYKGVSPIGQWPTLTQNVYEAFSLFAPISNFGVAFIQLAAGIVVFRIVILRFATLFYDALHIGIYVFGGLFFWPWVWNNVSVLFAIRGKTDADVSLYPRLCCIAVMALGFSSKLGDAAFLAWFDTTRVRAATIEIHDGSTNEWLPLPTSYFLSHSYAMSHGYFGHAVRDGHFSPSVGGTKFYDQFLLRNVCKLPEDHGRVESRQDYDVRLQVLERFLRAHHDKMLARADAEGHASIYLRGHHHPSNPLSFSGFSALDLRDVDAYRYLDISACLTMSDGRVREQIVKRDEHIVQIDRPNK